jgi:hypothetical protein
MPFKVGVTSGLYSIQRSSELASVINKIGFGLTRGVSFLQVDQDVPHEVTETLGRQARHMAEKQGLELSMHGSLTVPLDMPERSEYRDAQDHLRKSVKSSVLIRSRYVVFHACLNIWLELMTYAGRKLTMAFCDHKGRFISEILYESPKLREWFAEHRLYDYLRDVMSSKEREEVGIDIRESNERWYKEEMRRRMSAIGIPSEVIDRIQTGVLVDFPKVNEILERLKKERVEHDSDNEDRMWKDGMKRKLGNPDKEKRRWDSEELRASVGVLDGYMIMAHYLFYEKDPMWTEFAKLYGKTLVGKYKMDYGNKEWLMEAWRASEEANDRMFKEFFYGVVGAKYLEGHMERLFQWMRDEKEGLKAEIAKLDDDDEEKARLMKALDDIIIAVESPDARDPQHAGLHILWEPRQIFAAVKVIRQKLKTDKVSLLIDWEHIATQGVDPLAVFKDISANMKDFGEYVAAVHSGSPNPGHAHEPLDIGDVVIYTLLYRLRQTGLGRKGTVYIIFERGGGDDPFKQSIEMLKLCVKYLEQDTPPEALPLEFFGVSGPTTSDVRRQMAIVREHSEEPLKDLLEMSEEEWGLLSRAAQQKGKVEQWKKGRYR